MKDTAFLRKIVTLLQERGLNAAFEYPGYIGILKDGKGFAFGTAGGDWGWNDEDGTLAGSLKIPPENRNATMIADRIAEIMQQPTLEFMGDSPHMANMKKEALDAAAQFKLRSNAARVKKAALDAVAAHEKHAAPPEDEQGHNPYEGKEGDTPDTGLSGDEPPAPEPTEVERTTPATDPAPTPPPAAEVPEPSVSEESAETGTWQESEIRSEIEAEISDSGTVEAVMEFLKQEDFLNAHGLEVKEGVWGWHEAANFATISFGHSEYMVAPSSDAAEEFAKAMVRQQLDEEPELFSPAWLEGYIDEERLRDAISSDVEEMIRQDPDAYGWKPGRDASDNELVRYNAEGEEHDGGEYDSDGDLISEKDEDGPSDEWVEAKVERILKNPVDYCKETFGEKEGIKFAMQHGGINIEEAADDAIAADGAANFLASYDGEIRDLPSGGVWWRSN